MRISFSPVRADIPLEVFRAGDVLTINGDVFDFSPIPDGATLPRDAIGSQWFCDDVERVDGVIHLTLMLPHGRTDQYFAPEPITVTANGPVALPHPEPEPEAEEGAE